MNIFCVRLRLANIAGMRKFTQYSSRTNMRPRTWFDLETDAMSDSARIADCARIFFVYAASRLHVGNVFGSSIAGRRKGQLCHRRCRRRRHRRSRRRRRAACSARLVARFCSPWSDADSSWKRSATAPASPPAGHKRLSHVSPAATATAGRR